MRSIGWGIAALVGWIDGIYTAQAAHVAPDHGRMCFGRELLLQRGDFRGLDDFRVPGRVLAQERRELLGLPAGDIEAHRDELAADVRAVEHLLYFAVEARDDVPWHRRGRYE